MSDHVVTNNYVKRNYRDGAWANDQTFKHHADKEFDRWLASVKAQALYEAADSLANEELNHALEKRIRTASTTGRVRDWLYERANEIAKDTP